MKNAAPKTIPVATLVPGRAEAPVFVLHEPLSFWGGLDATSGKIIDRRHPQFGQSVSNKILMMEAGRGSSSGSSVLAETIRLGTGPAGIVLLTRDAIVTVGAIVAAELYGKECPVVLVRSEDWPRVATGSLLRVAADTQRGELTIV
jgi:predicted aconitase with swiveling domain